MKVPVQVVRGDPLTDQQSDTEQLIRNAADEWSHQFASAHNRWVLHAQGDLSDEYERAKLTASLAALGNPVSVENIQREFGIEHLDGRASMIQLGRILVESLTQDVADCLSDEEHVTLRRCQFQMIDIGETNALCTDRNVNGGTLPGYVILLNQGLYFCLKLLTTAQIYEDMRGDLAKYKQSGAPLFSTAVDLFITERPDKLNVGAVFTGDEKADGEIEANVSKGSILLMQFIMLHEVGHAHLKHNELLEQTRLNALAGLGRASVTKDELAKQGQYHKAEFEADAFAWKALVRRANSPISNFANLYCIRLFFQFLDAIEKKLGRPICAFHPSPKLRAARLVEMFAPDGLDEDQQYLFDRQDAILKRWLEDA